MKSKSRGFIQRAYLIADIASNEHTNTEHFPQVSRHSSMQRVFKLRGKVSPESRREKIIRAFRNEK